MKKISLFLLIVLSSMSAFSQKKLLADSSLFDFWVGEWEATWTTKAGKTLKANNSIKKILDGKVIQENFADFQGFAGTSISVYNSQTKTWHQAWADNQGGFYNLLGEVDGDKRIFRTPTREVGGKSFTQRMVFYDITASSMMWDWESSNDGGKTWQLTWRLSYKKKI